MKTLFTKGFYIVSAIIIFIGTALPARAQFTSVTLATNALATGLAKDASGNIYALQTDASGTQGEVVKYTNGTGSPTVIYDGFPDNDNAGDYGTGLIVTSNGDVYLTTDNNGATVPYGNIIKLKFNGGTSYTASVYQTGTASLGYYSALAVDASDNIYAVVYNINADGGNSGIGAYEVVKYAAGSAPNSAGTVLYDKLDAFGLLSGDYYTAPSGLAVNSLGDVYVADSFDNDAANNDGGHVYKLTKASSYAVSTISTNQYVTSLAVDAANNLYATQVNSFPAYALVRYTGDTGTPTTIFTGLSSDGFDFPYGLAIVNPTNIYVNDGGTNGGTDNQGNIIQLIGTPVTQVTNVNFTNTAATGTTANWTNGSGSSRTVFIAQASTGSPLPVNSTSYTANTAYASGTQIGGSGWYCVYNGTGSTVNITGLTAGNTYRVMAVEYNGPSGSQNYLTTTATNNPNNVTPVSAPTINTAGTLSALSTISGTASASTSFTISAIGLTAGVLVTPPSGFEVSTDNSTFSSTVTVGSTGTLSNTTVYVRLAAADAINTYSGNIVLSSAGATNVNVATASSTVTGQPTVLAAGDIAIIGYDFIFNTSGAAPVGQDNFDIVAFKNISAGTVIQFTTRGWTGTAFTSVGTIDGVFTWTVGTDIAAGTVFNFSLNNSSSPATVAVSPSNGTISGITAGEFTGTIGLAPALGNQLLIYQGSSTAPTFIYGINTDATNVDGSGWVTGTVANNAAQSALPPGLTNANPFNGTIAASALPFTIETNRYNAVYSGPKSGNQTILLKDIANYANWTATSTATTTYDLTVGGTNFPGSNPIFTLSSNTTIASINRSASSPTNATSVQYAVTFASAVTGVSASNFSLTTTGTISGASVASVAGSGTSYTVTVNTGTGDGTIVLNLANATGLSPGISTTLPFAGQAYTIDKTAPIATGLIYASNNTTNSAFAKVGDVISLTFSSSETVQTPVVTIAGHTITATSTGVNSYLASYTMTASDAEGRIPFTLALTDLVDNQTTYNDVAAGDDITFDKTVPTISIGNPSVSSTSTGPVTYSVTYADANFNTSTLIASNVSLITTGTATGTVSVTGSGKTYTVSISGISGTGTLGISIAASTASDLAGNVTAGSGPSATFTVTPALISQTITFNPLPTKTYGAVDFAPGATSTNNGTPAITYSSDNTAVAIISGGNIHIVGSGTAHITASQAGDGTHSAATDVSQLLTVAQAPLTITADNQTSTYGSALPALTASYGGFVNGDNAASLTTAPTLSVPATAASPANSYAITASGAVDPNYIITYVPGTLTIGKAALTITADNQTSTYGSALPTLTASYGGFVNGDNAGSLTTAPTLSTTATAASPVNTYPINASGAVDANYTITYIAGTLTIGKAALTVTADNQTSTYGAALPTLTASYGGFVNGDNAGSLTTAPTLSTTATAASPAGSYTITSSNAVDANYTITYVAGTLNIGKAALTITADNQSSTYGAALPTLTASYGGFVNGDNAASLTTAPTLSTSATAASPAGSYTITASNAVDANYTITYVAGTLNIGKASLTITADNQNSTYGSALPTLTASYGGFVNGDNAASLTTAPTISTSATSASPSGIYTITASGAVDANYTISYVAGTLSINQAALTITADNQTSTYGSALPVLTASYSGFVNGDNAGSLTTAPTIITTATASSPAGTYAVTVSGVVDDNYTISYVPGILTIGKANLTITADNKSIAHGAAIPTLTASYSGFVNGDNVGSLTTAPTLSTAATSASPAGSYAITASGAADANYNINYVAGTLAIGKALLTITVNNQTSVYGSALPTLTLSYSGFVNGDNAASLATQPTISTTATSASPAGTYALTASGAVDPNYAISYTPGTLTIGKAALTATADNQSSTYGSALPALTVSYSGFVNGDNAASLTTAATASTTASAASPAGSYSITPSGAVDPNYTINYVAGNLTIGKAALTVTADNQNSTYGSAIPALTTSYSGFVNGDNVANLTTVATASTTATAASPAGSYSIKASGAVDPNYTISYVPGTLTIGKANLTITADNQSIAHGAAIPTLTASYSGFVNGDNVASLTTAPTLSTTATSASPAGSYSITASGAVDPNYNISYVAGTLSIGKALLTITVDNQTSVYGSALPALTVSYSGFVGGDNAASLATAPTVSTTATSASPAGSYIITASGAVDPNYTISYVEGTLTIGKAALTITADNQTSIYGSALPALTASYSGFVNGDNVASLTITPALNTTATSASPSGTYPITASGAVDANYNISYVTGTLTIGKVPLTIIANNQTTTYGLPLPAFTATYTGFVNGDNSASLTTAPTITTTATSKSPVGTYPITASGAVDANYTITYVAGTLTVNQAIRTLTFNMLPVETYGNPDFDPGAVASDGETVIYTSSNPAAATILNGKIHITGAGNTLITATLAANANYTTTPTASQGLVINKANQTISVLSIPTLTKGTQYDLSVITSSSGLPLTFSINDNTIASISGQTLDALRIGTTSLTVSQPGDNNYNAASTTGAVITVVDAGGDEIVVHQAVSPNGDGINDVFTIEGIKNYPDNQVTIVNRNGVKIYQTRSYDNSSRVFDGRSNITGALQQAGTYFYLLEYTVNGESKRKTGFLVLKYQ